MAFFSASVRGDFSLSLSLSWAAAALVTMAARMVIQATCFIAGFSGSVGVMVPFVRGCGYCDGARRLGQAPIRLRCLNRAARASIFTAADVTRPLTRLGSTYDTRVVRG